MKRERHNGSWKQRFAEDRRPSERQQPPHDHRNADPR
jgi:hypothetical protein